MCAKFVMAVLSCALLAAAPVALTAAPQSSSSSASGSTATHSTKKKKSSHHHSSRREPFQKAPTASRISEIQTALSRGGYFEGEPNGKWDSSTIAALHEAFETLHGQDGIRIVFVRGVGGVFSAAENWKSVKLKE